MGTTKIGQMMAVAVVMTIPVLLIFFVCQKYFVQGIKMRESKDKCNVSFLSKLWTLYMNIKKQITGAAGGLLFYTFQPL